MHIVPSGAILGARVEGLDLAQPLANEDFRTLELALGRHGVLCFPKQTLTSFARDSIRFEEVIKAAGVKCE